MGYAKPFKEWVKNEYTHNLQIKHIAGCDDVDLAIKILNEEMFFVGLVEFFDESLVMLRKKIRDKNLDINYEAKNVASNSYIKNKLLTNSTTRNILSEINQVDDVLYRYVRKELYPRQKKEFGNKLELEVELFKSSNIIDPFTSFKAELVRGLHFVRRNILYRILLI